MSVTVCTGLILAGMPAASLASAVAAPAGAASGCAAPAAGKVSCGALVTPGSAAVRASALASAAASAPAGFGPLDLRSAYGLEFSAVNGGVGQTVAVVTAYDDATAEANLATYRGQYGLPACTTADRCFSKVDQTGGTSYPPTGQQGWSLATAQSLDVISAVCPNCHIRLVEASTTAITDLGQAENEAVTLGARFVTNTWFTPEATYGTSEPGYDSSYFDHPGVAITAADGNGAGYGTYYPAASPDVIAVGGTTLTAATTGARRWSETAWSGTGSGCSPYEAKPSWQADAGCSTRMLNDVSSVADPTGSPVAFYDASSGGWVTGGGDNVAAAIVAAAYALGGTPAAGSNPASYLYARTGLVNDITTGNDGTCAPSPAYFCAAGTDYDGPTGLGTPAGALGPLAPAASLPAAPAVYNPVTGNLEAYATGSSRTLEEDYWSATGGWSGWKSLGGSTIAGRPVAIYNPGSGNLEVYARTTGGTLDEDTWNSASGWSGLKDLGGSITGDPAAVYNPVTGSLEVYATGSGGTLEEEYWKPGSGWSGWKSLGGSITGGPSAVYDPASGNMDVYATGSGGALEQDTWKAATGWGWKSLGGSITDGPAGVYDPVDGNLEVYATAAGGALEEKYFNGTSWSGWSDLGGSLSSGPAADYNPVSDSLEVYAGTSSGKLAEDYWNTTAGWSGMKSLGGSLAGGPTALYDPAAGSLEVYALDTGGTLDQNAWSSASGWSGWKSLGGSLYAL